MLKKFLLVAALVILGTTIFAPSILLRPVGQFLVVENQEQTGDAIIVLLGEDRTERTDAAELLFKTGAAPKVIFIKGFRPLPWLSLGEPENYRALPVGRVYQERLVSLGIPASAIETIEYDLAYDTASELSGIAEFLRNREVRKALLVTSASHSRRVQIIWGRVAPDILGITYALPDPAIENWWTSKRCRRLVGHEYGGLLKELFRQVTGFGTRRSS